MFRFGCEVLTAEKGTLDSTDDVSGTQCDKESDMVTRRTQAKQQEPDIRVDLWVSGQEVGAGLRRLKVQFGD